MVPQNTRTPVALPIAVAVCHRDPLLQLGVIAALRGDVRFAIQDRGPATPDKHGQETHFAEADVVVADYEMGIAVAADAVKRARHQRVLVVTHRDGEIDVQRALSCGVLGYVLMGCGLEEIVDGTLAVHRGQRYFTQAAARRIAEHMLHRPLTKRELDVLHFIVAGWSNKMVANHLGMAAGTVKSHVKAILGKLDATSRTQAANVAQRRGLVPNDFERAYVPPASL
jgi:DNA-binding NarL/FixJ family response regulator